MKRFAVAWIAAFGLAVLAVPPASAADKEICGSVCTIQKATKSGQLAGAVKGAPAGKVFTVALKSQKVTVDATKARVRHEGGKFASFSVIKPGTVLRVKGSMKGARMKAREICICSEAQHKH